MSLYDDIRDMPTSISADEMRIYLSSGCSGVHESMLRSYAILNKVKRLLLEGTPCAVVLELIQMMEEKPDLAQRQQREAGADGNPETSAPAKEGA